MESWRSQNRTFCLFLFCNEDGNGGDESNKLNYSYFLQMFLKVSLRIIKLKIFYHLKAKLLVFILPIKSLTNNFYHVTSKTICKKKSPLCKTTWTVNKHIALGKTVFLCAELCARALVWLYFVGGMRLLLICSANLNTTSFHSQTLFFHWNPANSAKNWNAKNSEIVSRISKQVWMCLSTEKRANNSNLLKVFLSQKLKMFNQRKRRK